MPFAASEDSRRPWFVAHFEVSNVVSLFPCDHICSEHSLEEVGSGSEVGDGAEVLDGVALLLEGVIGSGRAFEDNVVRVDFKGLLCIGSFDDAAFHNERAAYVELGDFSEVCKLFVVYDLDGFEECAVGKHDEAEGLGRTDTAHPAADNNVVMIDGIALSVELTDTGKFHNRFSFI